MKAKLLGAVVVVILVVLGAVGHPAAQGTASRYGFTVIASTAPGGGFIWLDSPTINPADSRVGFGAARTADGAGVYTGDGGPITTIEEWVTAPASGSFKNVTLDAQGGAVWEIAGASRVMAGTGGSPSVFADDTLTVLYGNDPQNPGPFTCHPQLAGRTIGAGGQVPLVCGVEGSGLGLYLGDGSTTAARVCDNSWSWADPTAPNSFCVGGDLDRHVAAISPSGTVAAAGYDARTGLPSVALGSTGGLSVITSATDLGSLYPETMSLSDVAVNDAGTVVFAAFITDATGASNWTIFRNTGGRAQRVISLAGQQATSGFAWAAAPSINAAGELAFQGGRKDGVWSVVQGIYTGSDPVLDKVIEAGDEIPGYSSRVSNIAIGQPALNDAGAIAFHARLIDGTQLIVRADPRNRAPVVTSPGDQSSLVEYPEWLRIDASDPDPGDVLSFADNGTLPPGLSINAQGEITGVPPASSAGTTYTVTITVSDGQAQTSVTFTWEITDTPLERGRLQAMADYVDDGIILGWYNPQPDSADTIEVWAGQEGVQLERVAVIDASFSTYRYSADGWTGYPSVRSCFQVYGVTAGGARSPASNLACRTYPWLDFTGIQTSVTATTATVVWSTTMPAVMTFTAPPGVSGTLVATNPARTHFALTLTGLTVGTGYIVNLHASTASGQEASARPAFTTLPQIIELAAEIVDMRVGRTVVGAIERDANNNPVGVLIKELEIDVRLSNRSEPPVAIDSVTIARNATLDVPCPEDSNLCMSFFNTYPDPVRADGHLDYLRINPLSLGTIPPNGQSRLVTLTFHVESYVLSGITGLGSSTRLRLNTTYSVGFASHLQRVNQPCGDFHVSPGSDIQTVISVIGSPAGVSLCPRLNLPRPAVDLEMSLSVHPQDLATTTPQRLSYSAEVTNASEDPATGVSLLFSLPAHSELVTVRTIGAWRCRHRARERQVVCEFAASLPGGSGDWRRPTVVFEVNVVDVSDGALTATASAFGAQPDPELSNNTAATTARLPFAIGGDADLSATLRIETAEVTTSAWRTVDVFLSIRNNGPEWASNVVATYELPGWLHFHSVLNGHPGCQLPADLPPGSGRLASRTSCGLGFVAPGETIELYFTGRRPLLSRVDPVSASVAGSGPDPFRGNNSTSGEIRVAR